MRSREPEESVKPTPAWAEDNEERLRRENADLKRQLLELKNPAHGSPHTAKDAIWHPSGVIIWAIFLAAIVLVAIAFFAGYLPIEKRRTVLGAEMRRQEESLPRVEVVPVGRSSANSELELPGNIQAITEAPILARASGYVQKRLVDIGDRVRAGQPVAEIEAPELDDQVRQAEANVQQTQAALAQALANYEQGKSDAEFARVTAERWSHLLARGVVSRQENDQYQTQYQSRTANVQALEKAIAAQRSNIGAAEANLNRLREMQGFRIVKAPFDGVVTLRNVDVGALVNAGSTMLFRIAQTNALRIYLNVPQTNSSSVRPGQVARLHVSNLPGREFTGTVARTANALDPTSRTMLVEVHVQNADGALFPGMYAQVDLSSSRARTPLLVPGDALIVRAEGTSVAVVRPDHTVHLQKIEIGRDYGDRLEVTAGLQEGDLIIPNPGDSVREGLEVNPVARQ